MYTLPKDAGTPGDPALPAAGAGSRGRIVFAYYGLFGRFSLTLSLRGIFTPLLRENFSRGKSVRLPLWSQLRAPTFL